MAIENQAAVRGAHRAHHAGTAGAHKGAAAAGEDAVAATGFSALLGAAADDAETPGGSLVSTPTGLPADALASPTAKPVLADASTGSDAAALAAWAGLLQPAAVTPATVMPAAVTSAAVTSAAMLPAASAHLAPLTTAATAPAVSQGAATFMAPAAAVPRTSANTHTGPALSGGQTKPGPATAGGLGAHGAHGAHGVPANAQAETPVQGANEHPQAATTLQAAPTGAVRVPPLDLAVALNAAPVTSTLVSAPSLGTPAQPGQALPADPAVAAAANNPPAPGMVLRPAAVAARAAVAGAPALTVAPDKADTAAIQAATLSTGAIAVSAGDAAPVRGPSSTVSLGEGSQSRWAGALADIVRPIQAENAAGGFSGGASPGQERGRGGDNRGADGTGAATGFNASGMLPATGAADGSFASPSTAGDDARAASTGMVMTPDEWLAATTAPINPQSLQTAELTVDAFGAPVDVKISLSGSEAQVAFQSDQADTRAMLGGAVSDLQNLLRQEGLVLSGVSVGGSNAGQAGNAPGFGGEAHQGGNRPRNGDAIRITPGIPVSTPVAAASARSAAATARGGLDLFA